ncbi:MAG: sigma-70 family RNA polymerase sigma factor [Planctomycetes bacterium]|nr:sigma-70 family RNA polymerase sigma factor [Planctomycetota bacterium]
MQSEYDEDPGVRWMRAWQAGDEGAFDALVEAYSPQVYALLTRFLGQRANREDLVQEVFLRVVRARERYEPSARFSTFLFRIAYNISVNETQRGIAREAGRVELGGDANARSSRTLAEFEDTRAEAPGAELERDDVVREVRAAIARLPENQRMALLLAKYEELPYSEIGEVLGTSEKAVKSMVHRARESLRESLAALLEEEEA